MEIGRVQVFSPSFHSISAADLTSAPLLQCPTGTYACWKTVNQRAGEGDRVIRVVPLATANSLNSSVEQSVYLACIEWVPVKCYVLTHQCFTSVSNGKISILLHGPGYPPSSHNPQTLNFVMECSQADNDPTILDYTSNSATVSWKNKAACQTANDPTSPPSDEPQPPHTGSGVGWFFTVYVFKESLYGNKCVVLLLTLNRGQAAVRFHRVLRAGCVAQCTFAILRVDRPLAHSFLETISTTTSEYSLECLFYLLTPVVVVLQGGIWSLIGIFGEMCLI